MCDADIFDPGLLMNLCISARQMGEFLQESLVFWVFWVFFFFFSFSLFFQFNGKFWQPSQFRSELFKQEYFHQSVFFFFNPVKRRRRSRSAQVWCYFFFFLSEEKKKQNTATI